MKRSIICLLLTLLAVGCLSPEAEQARKDKEAARKAEMKAEAERTRAEKRSKLDLLKTMKILNIRDTDTTIDVIVEDGSIITLYSYTSESEENGRKYYSHHLGVK